MSIRLRLTLLYSGILLPSLVVFGVLIYVVQAQATIAIEEQALVAMSQRVARPKLLERDAGGNRPGDFHATRTNTTTGSRRGVP